MWRAWINRAAHGGLLVCGSPAPPPRPFPELWVSLSQDAWGASSFVLVFPHLLSHFSSLVFHQERQGQTLHSAEAVFVDIWKKKKREKSQRSFKVMMFEYLKTMNARNIDRSCVRLHSGSSAHYFIFKNRRSSIFRGFVQSKCAIQTSCLSAPSPSSLPLCCCSSRSAPHLACPGVWGLGEDMGWEEDWVVGLWGPAPHLHCLHCFSVLG